MLMEQEKHRMMEPLFDYDELGGQSALVGNGLTGMDILSVDQFDKAKSTTFLPVHAKCVRWSK